MPAAAPPASAMASIKCSVLRYSSLNRSASCSAAENRSFRRAVIVTWPAPDPETCGIFLSSCSSSRARTAGSAPNLFSRLCVSPSRWRTKASAKCSTSSCWCPAFSASFWASARASWALMVSRSHRIRASTFAADRVRSRSGQGHCGSASKSPALPGAYPECAQTCRPRRQRTRRPRRLSPGQASKRDSYWRRDPGLGWPHRDAHQNPSPPPERKRAWDHAWLLGPGGLGRGQGVGPRDPEPYHAGRPVPPGARSRSPTRVDVSHMKTPSTQTGKTTSIPPDILREIESFEEEAGKVLRGELSQDLFRPFRLQHGIYGQRQPGVQMVRIKIPFGGLNSIQLRVIAEMAERYTTGVGHVTTRQDIQLHFAALEHVGTIMRRLA